MKGEEIIKTDRPADRRRKGDADPRPLLLGMSAEELAAFAVAQGEPVYRGRQLYEWIYAKRAASFETMTSLPADLRARLAEAGRLRTLDLCDQQRSADGTIKFLFR